MEMRQIRETRETRERRKNQEVATAVVDKTRTVRAVALAHSTVVDDGGHFGHWRLTVYVRQ